MPSPRLIKVVTLVIAGGIAVAVLLQLGTRSLGLDHGALVDINIGDVGPVVQQARSLGPFDAIDLRNQADIDVSIGTPQAVTVETGENLQRALLTRVEDHTLIVDAGTTRRFHWLNFSRGEDSPRCRIHITVPALTALRVSGAGRFKLHQLKGEQFDFDMAGAGELSADGTVDNLKLRISGAAKVDTSAVQAKTVDVEVDGAGDAIVRAQDSLSANVAGIGRIVYYGNPASVEKHVSGIGSIKAGESDAAPNPG
jgi:hypothetical protein